MIRQPREREWEWERKKWSEQGIDQAGEVPWEVRRKEIVGSEDALCWGQSPCTRPVDLPRWSREPDHLCLPSFTLQICI